MSKKLLSVILAIITMASLCIVNASAANAADASTGVLHEGDKVIYTASLKYGDDTHYVAAINATVKYDAEVLSIANVRSVEYPVFNSGTTNLNEAGTVLFNAADGANGRDFSKGGALIKITFDVKKDVEDTKISFASEELFDVTIDPETLQAADGVAKNDITSGVTAEAKVECVNVVDSDKDTTTDKPVDTSTDTTTDTSSDKVDENKAPITGDVATVAMMLVFAAAVVVLVSKKRA
ncbi:MAG: cohesin domain-containing protein [Clostridia bacterium]|nr:cohesin domain-containing protein [Clostridia bacterium]